MERLEVLFERYLANTISEDEFREFWQLLEREGQLNKLTSQLQALWQQEPEYSLPDAEWDFKFRALKAVQSPSPKRKILTVWRYVAAACIFFLFTGYWFYIHQANPPSLQAQNKIEAAPGHNGAVLTLSNGTKIVLDDAGNGQLAKDADVSILKKDGEITYKGKTDEIVYNSISTDKGRQWQLKLPDGSRVWLNSVSSIRYPLSFTGNERLVEITGEAYFEVKHNAKQPFKVKVGNRIIEDIGTSFNVNAYADEPLMKTTLIEGAVQLSIAEKPSSAVIVKVGEEASVTPGGHIKIAENVDVDDAVSWKNGMFSFNHTDIKNIMRQISRWYDLEVTYTGNTSKETFTGIVSRNSNLSQVLKIMEQASIKFKQEGKKLIVIQ